MLSNIERQQDLNYQTENQIPDIEQTYEQVCWERRKVRNVFAKLKIRIEYVDGLMRFISKIQQDPRGRDPQQQLDFLIEWLQRGQEWRRESKLRVRNELDKLNSILPF